MLALAGLVEQEIDDLTISLSNVTELVSEASALPCLLCGQVVDLEKEKAKLLKEQGKLEGQIGGLERKLSNEGFLAKAPAAVVEKERAQLSAMQARLEAITQSLNDL